jgi:hypothetical protein
MILKPLDKIFNQIEIYIVVVQYILTLKFLQQTNRPLSLLFQISFQNQYIMSMTEENESSNHNHMAQEL